MNISASPSTDSGEGLALGLLDPLRLMNTTITTAITMTRSMPRGAPWISVMLASLRCCMGVNKDGTQPSVLTFGGLDRDGGNRISLA